jgi:lipopolysaccharide transport system ATP-binding protein
MRKKEVDQKFDEIVEFSGVEKFLDTPVKRYSSGMRVRLAFAVAAHLEPEILIVDEVLAVGDAEFQKKCISKMEDVGNLGRTVIFVSHNMGAITKLCNRAIWLENGHLNLQGTTEEVITSYLNQGSAGQSVWNAGPGDRGKTAVNMLGARIVNSANRRPNEMTSHDNPVDLEIEYELKSSSNNISTYYLLMDVEGNVIFMSRDTDNNNSRFREAGKYISSCQIPRYLRPGRYFVTIGASEGPKLQDRYENVLAFDITSVGCNVNPDRKGMIIPILDWNVNKQAGNIANESSVVVNR